MDGVFDELSLPEEERWENLTLANDFMFGHIMRKKSLCLEMMRRILPGKSIDDIRLIETQKTLRAGIDSRGVRLDMMLEGGREVIDTEIQTSMTPDLSARTRAYHAMMGSDILDKFKNEGRTYNDMPESYVIFICTFDPFRYGKHVYTFMNFCCEDKSLALADGSTTIFLNACGKDKATPKMKAFLDFIMGKECGDPFIQELKYELDIAKHSAQWRGEYMKALMERNEFIARAKAQGMAQGMAQGRTEGRTEGRIEGRKGEKFDTAIRLSRMGLSAAEIMQGTQLTMAELLQIIPSLRN